MRRFFLVLALLLLGVPASARKASTKDLVVSFESAKSPERIRLAATLGRRREKSATAALIKALDVKGGNPRESAAIVDALGLAADERSVDALSGAWDYLRGMLLQMSELPGHLQVLRWKILNALSRVGGDQVVRTLSESLNDPDPRVVEEAVRGLGRLQVKDAVPALQQLAGSSSGNQLQAVLEALGDIGDKRALSTLEQAIKNPDKFIEVEASYALAKFGKKDAVARLNDALSGDPGENKVGLLAAYYLVKLDKDAGLSHLENLMTKADSALAPLAAEALGKSGNPRAAMVLVEAVKSTDPSVRLAAARALTMLGGGRAISALKKMRADSNPGVRTAALAGLTEFGEND